MAVWFATANGNINSANRWNDLASGTGNALTWASLAAGDVLCANGKTVAANVGFTCARISTVAEVGSGDTGAAGGGFTVAGAVALVCAVLSGTTTCLASTGTGYTWTLNGVVHGGAAVSACGVQINGAHTLTHTGTCTGGSAAAAHGISVDAAGAVLNNTGNATGGASNARGIHNQSTGTVDITGDVEGGTGVTAHGVYSNTTGPMIIRGNILNTAGKATGAGGFSPDWRPVAANYSRWVSNGSTIDAPQGLAAGNIKARVVSGTVTGTFGGDVSVQHIVNGDDNVREL